MSDVTFVRSPRIRQKRTILHPSFRSTDEERRQRSHRRSLLRRPKANPRLAFPQLLLPSQNARFRALGLSFGDHSFFLIEHGQAGVR
jgi:hypothetical protein